MAFFSSIAAAFTVAGTWFAGLSVAGQFAVRLGVSLAVNALAGAISSRGQEKRRAPGVVGEVRQGADVPRSFIAGRYATRGSLAYRNTWGKDGDTPNAYYTRVTALSDLPIRGLVEVWIDGRRCTLGDVADPLKGFPVLEYTGTRSFESYAFSGDRVTVEPGSKAETLAWIKFYDGTQTAADDFLTGTVSTPERPWTASEVGVGVAYAVATFKFDRETFQGFPDVLFVVDGIEIEDPETGRTGTADANPAAIAYTILRGLSYAGQWFWGPQGRGAGRVRANEWAEPVAACKAPVPRAVEMSDAQRLKAFGTTDIPEKYRAGLEISVDQAPSDVLGDVFAACAGRMAETGTRYLMQVGDPKVADFAFTDADILSTEEQEFVPFLGIADAVNGVSATYPAPDEGWAMQNAPPRYVAAYEAEDGNRRLATDVALVAVPFAEQVQRLQKAVLAEARRARRHSLVMPPQFVTVQPLDYAAWDSARNGYQSKLMRVDGVVPLPNGNVQIDLTEVDPADYYWRPAVDFVPVVSGSIAPQGPGVVAVSGFQVSAITIRGADGAPRRPALRLRWIPVIGVRALAWRVRVKATGAIVADGVREDVDAGMAVVSEGLLRKTVYEAQVKFRPRGQLRGIWTAWTSAETDDVGLRVVDVDDETWTAIDGRAGSVAEALLLDFEIDEIQPIRDQIPPIEQSIVDHGLELQRLNQTDSDFAYAQTQLTQTVEANRVAAAQARTDLGAAIDGTAALLQTESQTRADETSGLASDVTRLQAEIDAAEGGIASNASAVSGLATRVTAAEGEITSQAENITSLTSRIGTAESDISAGATATNNLTTRVSSAEGKITSQGQAITTLQSDLDAAESDISAGATATNNLATRVTSAEGKITSQGQSITNLTSRIGTAESNISAGATATNNLTTRVSSAEGKITSQGQAITSLQSDLDSAESGISANASAHNALKTRVTNAEGKITSQASSINSLTARVGDTEADVSTQSGVIANLDGTVAAAHLLRARGGGATGELEIVAGSTPKGAASLVQIRSDRLKFIGEWTDFFSNVKVHGNLAVKGTFTRPLFGTGELQVPLYPIYVEHITSSDPSWRPRQNGLAQVFVIGGGGGGGACADSNDVTAAGGGGAGGVCVGFIPDFRTTDSYNLVVGGGGGGRSSEGGSSAPALSGYGGGQSKFLGNGCFFYANGGGGGGATKGRGYVPRANGGTASGGTYNYSGGNGADAQSVSGSARPAGGGGAPNFGLGGLISAPSMVKEGGDYWSGRGYNSVPNALVPGEVTGFVLNGAYDFTGGGGASGPITATGGPGKGPACGGGGAVTRSGGTGDYARSGAGANGLIVVVYYGAGNLS